jgi:hypothetical protein
MRPEGTQILQVVRVGLAHGGHDDDVEPDTQLLDIEKLLLVD